MTTKLPRVWSTVNTETDEWLTRFALNTSQPRGSAAGGVIRAFRDLIRMEAHRIQLTVAEADFLAAALRDHTVHGQPQLGAVLYAEITGDYWANREHPAPAGLMPKLREIGPATDLALRLAFTDWWSLPEGERDYRKVGLNLSGEG